MKVNVKHLAKGLQKAGENPDVPTESCNPYLLEKVLYPVMRGEAPKLRDLDYSQFEEEDISDLAAYCESRYEEGRKLEQLLKAVSTTIPIACRSRQFC